MPMPIFFSKARAEYLLDRLSTGKPIEGVRTVNDFLALAGACYFAAMSHGPPRLGGREWSELPEERREAGEETHVADTLLAIEFYAQLTMMVKHGEYDTHWEGEASAIVFWNEDTKALHPLRGYRYGREDC
jgi:hypothetical protein